MAAGSFAKSSGRLYFQDFMGHVHKEPTDGSASLTAIQCAFSVAVLSSEDNPAPTGWIYVKAGEDKGYVRSRFLGTTRPDCFQETYPKFYNNMNFDLADLYYWGRLSDHFIEGESLAP